MLTSMRPQQLRALLKKAGLTQTDAAHLIGLTARSMRRYVSGETPVPRVVVYALLYVIKLQKDLEPDVQREAAEKYQEYAKRSRSE